MAVRTERIPGRTVERATTGRSAVIDELGGPPLEVRHLPTEHRQAAQLLAHELRVICGSLDRSGAAGAYSLQPLRGSWRTLRDVSEELLLHTVRRVERTFPGWQLPEGQGVHQRVETFLMGDS